MGTFSVTVEIGTPSAVQFTQVEALVDTGATYTVLPAEALVRLGIQAIETVSFELADDRFAEYEVGETRVRLDGRERTTLVVFGPEGAAPLLGATTLQLFNLAVYPTRERLVPVPALLKRLQDRCHRPPGNPPPGPHVEAPACPPSATDKGRGVGSAGWTRRDASWRGELRWVNEEVRRCLKARCFLERGSA